MINLGDINFSLGADTTQLRNAASALQNFGQVVNTFQTMTQRTADQVAAALRRQEKSAVDALTSVQRLNNQMRSFKGTDSLIAQTSQAFATLQGHLQQGALTSLQYQRAMEQFKATMAGVQRQFSTLKQEVAGGSGSVSKLTSMMQDLSSATVLVSGPLSGFAVRMGAITAAMKRGGVAAAAFIAGFSTGSVVFYKFGQTVLDAGVKMKAFESQFQAVTGSIPQSMAQVMRAIEIARNAGQRIEDIAPAFAKFQAAAAGTSLEGKETVRTFESVSAAASKMYLGSEQVAGIFRALEQMISKGTVQAEELRGQLGDRLPGAFQIAARALGVTTSKLGEFMKKGQVLTADFLPRFIREMERTFNIDGRPIDNYTAAVNNNATAWFQLRAELDKQLGISDKVMQGYKTMTVILDTLRNNLELVRVVGIAVTGVLFGIAAPALLSSLGAITMWFGRITKAMLLLNVAVNANPFVRLITLLIKLASVAASVAGAFVMMGDNAYVLTGQFGTLNAWLMVINNEINKPYTSGGSWLSKAALEIRALWQETMRIVNNAVDEMMRRNEAARQDLNSLMSGAMKLGQIVGMWWRGETGVEEVWNGPQKAPSWIENTRKEMERLKAEAEATGAMLQYGQFLAEGYTGGGQTGPKLPKSPTLPKWSPGPGKGGGKGEEAKLQRRLEAMKAINDELERTYEEIEALGGTEAGLEALTDQFAREKEVEKYAKAMRKAGVDTEFIAKKTKELNAALEKKDLLEKQRQALVELRDTIATGFDNIFNSVFDAIWEGKNAFEALRDAGKAMAQDLLKTFMQLAIMNPLKNMLFGLNEPTMGGGWLSMLGKIFGGWIGGGGASANAHDFDTWGKKGLIYKPTRFMNHGDILSKPTRFMSSGGPIIGGEAGQEALMPLRRDSSGRLGVSATTNDNSRGGTIINVNNYGQERVTQTKRKGPNGRDIIDMNIGSLVESASKGSLDGVMAQRYGLKPKALGRA